jgi:hypothetical protein
MKMNHAKKGDVVQNKVTVFRLAFVQWSRFVLASTPLVRN